MKKAKKIIIGVVVTALVVGGCAGGAVYFRKNNTETVKVVGVDSLASQYYMDDTSLEGNIVTNVTQGVTMDKDMVIKEVYVSEGDSVKKGDKLVSFDMTLVQMELNIAKLKQQQQEQDLDKAASRLNSLQNGGPIEEEDSTGDFSFDDEELGADDGDMGDDDTGDDDMGDDMSDDLASAAGNVQGVYLAAVMRPVLAAAQAGAMQAEEFTSGEALSGEEGGSGGADGQTDGSQGGVGDGTGSEGSIGDGSGTEGSGDGTGGSGSGTEGTGGGTGTEGSDGTDGTGSGSGDPFGDGTGNTPTPGETTGGDQGTEQTPSPTPDGGDIDVDFGDGTGETPSPAPGDGTDDFTDVEIVDPDTETDISDFTDGDPTFYQVLDGDTQPFTGTGTEEDPYVFLCSSAKGVVIAKGSFLNKMAGFRADGTKDPGVNGYWYQLEFHQNDTITNFEDRKESCTGYYLIDGSLLEEMADDDAEVEYTLDGATQYEENLPDDGGDGGDDGDGGSTMSREDAIKSQETKVESLRLDIRESKIEIGKLEKKVKKETVYSKLDGTVAKVGDPDTGASDGSSFMTIKSKEGYYVKGTVSELMLDQVKEGTKLNCSGSNGTFEADVIDVSEYPVSSNSYMGSGNPNVSYYTYSATIPDKSIQVSEDDWLSITLKNSQDAKNMIVLDRAFVRTENSKTYVYKDDNGTLKKQYLTVEGNANGGYSVLVKSGITREDKIAFPYGKTVKEGAKTQETTLDQFYQDY